MGLSKQSSQAWPSSATQSSAAAQSHSSAARPRVSKLCGFILRHLGDDAMIYGESVVSGFGLGLFEVIEVVVSLQLLEVRLRFSRLSGRRLWVQIPHAA